MMPARLITRTVWVLSLVSLFTDMASEMLYPVLPLYLKSIGFSVILIGVLEGMAEAIAGLSKGYFGQLSDVRGRRMPFVQLGYALSALSKPAMIAFAYPLWIFMLRCLDRLGKGIRTGARDAVLSAESTPQTRAGIFGFHRSMDTMGAVIGPAAALTYLYFYPHRYRELFLFAAIPGLLAVILSFTAKDKPAAVPLKEKITFLSFIGYWKRSPPAYRKLVNGLLLFALFNSSDVFLLLKVKQAGADDVTVIGIYIFYNAVYAICSFPLGKLADRIGVRKVLLAGMFIFSVVYFGIGFADDIYSMLPLFLLYGIYAAATEGLSKAWISNITGGEYVATAIGTYAAFQSICAMLASFIAGIIWVKYGAVASLVLTGIMSLLAILYIAFSSRKA